jgi:hypothetical protein
MATWSDFAAQQPEMAGAGRALLYQHGVGLAFLATMRGDGRPRLHPMCPLLCDDGLFGFIVPSPKQKDLLRDGAFAMHSFPCPENEDAFYLAGTAQPVGGGRLRSKLAEQFVKERETFAVPAPAEDHLLFRFDLTSCLLTRTKGHGDAAPAHQVWREQTDRANRDRIGDQIAVGGS